MGLWDKQLCKYVCGNFVILIALHFADLDILHSVMLEVHDTVLKIFIVINNALPDPLLF